MVLGAGKSAYEGVESKKLRLSAGQANQGNQTHRIFAPNIRLNN